MVTNNDFWSELITIFDAKYREFNATWMQKHWVLETKILVIIIIKLIVSKIKQGYAINLWQLWESCPLKDMDLPQLTSVLALSVC